MFGWTTAKNNAFLASLGVLGIFAQVVLLPQSLKRFGDERTLLLAGASQTLCYILFSITYYEQMMWFDLCVSMFGAVALPATRAELSKEISRSCQGQLQGAMSSIMTSGGMIGTVIATGSFGIFVRRDNPTGIYLPTAPFVAGAVINAGAVWFMWRAMHWPRAKIPIEYIPTDTPSGNSGGTASEHATLLSNSG